MGRKDARITAMKMIFSDIVSDINESPELFDDSIALATHIDEETTVDLSLKDLAFIKEIIYGVKEKQEELDEKISSASKGWKISRIPHVDLAIMRVAAYEMFYREDIPISVSINESVEMAKKYCEKESSAFINGVLGNIAKNDKLES